MEQTAIKISGLHHYAIAVQNLTTSIHFYKDILGFQLIERPDFDFKGAWLDPGNGIEIHLIEVKANQNTVVSGSRMLHFAFNTPDIFAAKNYLMARHIIPVKDIKPRPDGVLQMFIQDPDGYFIEITQAG